MKSVVESGSGTIQDRDFGSIPISGTGGQDYDLGNNSELYATQKIQQNLINDFQKKIGNLEKKLNKETDNYKKQLVEQGHKNIEIIGIFSAVLALLIIDVNIIKSATNFLSALLLVIALTASLLIFVCAMHYFFQGKIESNKVASQIIAASIGSLVLLLGIAIWAYFNGNDLFGTQTHENSNEFNSAFQIKVQR